jgi:HK97 family phage prohead protease
VLQKSDIILNLNHNSNVVNVLGRYRNNPDKDTLKLEMRGDGIDCECDLPETTAANDTLTLIKRGVITGMSFAFDDDYEDSENGVSYEKTNDIEDGKVVWLRHVKRITALYDVSIVTHPAYEQTSVATRESSDRIDAAIEAQLKRECGGGEDDEAKKKAEEEAKAEEERKAKEEQEARELAEREQKEREAVAVMRMRRNRLALQNRDIETFSY